MCACIQKFHLIIYFFLPWWKWFCDIISLLYRLHSKHPRWKTKENTKHTKHHEDFCHPLEQQPLILAIKPISIIAPMALTKFSIWLSQNVHALSLSLSLYLSLSVSVSVSVSLSLYIYIYQIYHIFWNFNARPPRKQQTM